MTVSDLYILDANNVVWKCCPQYDNTMFTRADDSGEVWSAGIGGLTKEAGPLIRFSARWLRTQLDPQGLEPEVLEWNE